MHTTSVLCFTSRRLEVSKIQRTKHHTRDATMCKRRCLTLLGVDDTLTGSHKRFVSSNTTYEALSQEAYDRICAKQDALIAVNEQDEELLIQPKLMA